MDLNTLLKSINEFLELIEVESISNELKNYDGNFSKQKSKSTRNSTLIIFHPPYQSQYQ